MIEFAKTLVSCSTTGPASKIDTSGYTSYSLIVAKQSISIKYKFSIPLAMEWFSTLNTVCSPTDSGGARGQPAKTLFVEVDGVLLLKSYSTGATSDFWWGSAMLSH